jgi:hypothetical protein
MLTREDNMFDWKKPTTQMLGRWQPWHDGHSALFKKALAETGQVCIMIRDVGGIVGIDAGAERTVAQNDNPFDIHTVTANIEEGLAKEGFTHGVEYELWSWSWLYIYTARSRRSCAQYKCNKDSC